ncbi:DUF3892 domain-containing protein [Spartobacteria bacterium LR76]|nr:DUF3892 domain-containing protein [Spartobacteria bacterium LR76]
MEVEVKCINKTDRQNPHERIKNIGGFQQWKLSEAEAIAGIEAGTWQFYVNVNNRRVRVIVATRLGVKYLKTENDGDHPNNLLSLPECP